MNKAIALVAALLIAAAAPAGDAVKERRAGIDSTTEIGAVESAGKTKVSGNGREAARPLLTGPGLN
jgi:hypothetical protein